MANSTHEVLLEHGFIPSHPLKARKALSLSEQGKRYRLDISGTKQTVAYQVDGNIIVSGRKCDKLVLVRLDSASEEWAQILVELKGGGVEHALEQLIATAKNPMLKHPTNVVRRARVVATSFPANKANPNVEKLKLQLLQMGIDYKGLKSDQPDGI